MLFSVSNIMTIFGAILIPSWRYLGPSWGVLGRLRGVLGASWSVLGASWGVLGASGKPRWRQDGAKLAPRSRQDGARWRLGPQTRAPRPSIAEMTRILAFPPRSLLGPPRKISLIAIRTYVDKCFHLFSLVKINSWQNLDQLWPIFIKIRPIFIKIEQKTFFYYLFAQFLNLGKID